MSNIMKTNDKSLAISLMDIEAVLLRPAEPFTWASGWRSPIYCDNRRILSYPSLRKRVGKSLADIVRERYPDVEVIAGVATGAIAHGLLVAEDLEKPFAYVRPKPKDHGTGSQIEGILPEGAKVVVVEDLISTGKSSLAAVDALRKAGAEVLGMVAIFTYAFDIATEKFEEAEIQLDTLSNYPALIQEAQKIGYVKPEQVEVLNRWRENPSGNWYDAVK